MVFKSEGFPGGDGDARVFENDGPFGGVVDSLAGVGGIVGVPRSSGGQTEINGGICGDIENPVRPIGPRHHDGRRERGTAEGSGEEDGVFHGEGIDRGE